MNVCMCMRVLSVCSVPQEKGSNACSFPTEGAFLCRMPLYVFDEFWFARKLFSLILFAQLCAFLKKLTGEDIGFSEVMHVCVSSVSI